MNTPNSRRPLPDTEGGPESLLPGERWGEGSQDLWKHVERDEQRKTGQGNTGKKKPPTGENLPTPARPPAD